MIVEIPGCKFRVSGEDCDWQVQYPQKRGDGTSWNGRYFYSHLEHAMAKAYELMLRESDAAVGFADVPTECRKAKDALVRAVKKVVGE